MAKLNAIFFLTLIVLIPLGYSADVLDNALIPKFCYLSLGLLAFYLAYFKKLYVLPFKINWFDLFLLAYLSLSFISIFQAINKPETLYESLKIVLFVAAYYMSLFLINEDRDLAFQKIAIAACIATFLAFSFSIN